MTKVELKAYPSCRDPQKKKIAYPSCRDPQKKKNNYFFTVFRIRDILLRIRILGSLPLTNRSGRGSVPYYLQRLLGKSIFFIFFNVSISET
jgi:hypothetical protein